MSNDESWQSQREMIIPEAVVETVKKSLLHSYGCWWIASFCRHGTIIHHQDRSRYRTAPSIYCYFIFYINMLLVYNYNTISTQKQPN